MEGMLFTLVVGCLLWCGVDLWQAWVDRDQKKQYVHPAYRRALHEFASKSVEKK